LPWPDSTVSSSSDTDPARDAAQIHFQSKFQNSLSLSVSPRDRDMALVWETNRRIRGGASTRPNCSMASSRDQVLCAKSKGRKTGLIGAGTEFHIRSTLVHAQIRMRLKGKVFVLQSEGKQVMELAFALQEENRRRVAFSSFED
jgi:hypothetical protein